MLQIKNLSISADGIEQVVGASLTIADNETQALIGPKFSGKSCLAYAIIGHPALEITQGSISFNKKKINNVSTEIRAKSGIYLCRQHAPNIDNINQLELIQRCAKLRNDTRSSTDIEKAYLEISNQLLARKLYDEEFLRLDLLLISILKPSLIILDEIDHFVFKKDIKVLAEFIKEYTEGSSKLVITNNEEFLTAFDITTVSVMANGEIQRTGSLQSFEGIFNNVDTQLP